MDTEEYSTGFIHIQHLLESECNLKFICVVTVFTSNQDVVQLMCTLQITLYDGNAHQLE